MIHSRHIIIVILAVFALMSVGCHHDNATMQQLAGLDSMVYHQQEREALPILQKMDIKGFNDEEKSYYSLLLAMAQYKCYQPFTSDSAINEAVEHYRKSGDKVKYLKALVAQGCVNEDLGHLDLAVESYHHAEELPLATDSSMIAYAKLRMGVLYQNQIIGSNTIALQKLQEALPLYRSLGDRHYELICLSSIAGIYRNIEEKRDSAVIYLNGAIDLAKSLNEQNVVFANLFLLSEYYLVREHDYEKAKHYALQAISTDGITIDHPRAHYRLASSYLFLGQPDSAVYYLNKAPIAKSAMDSIVYYELMSELEHRYWKNEGKSKNYIQQAHAIADSLTMNSLNHRLLAVEKKYDVQLAELNKIKYQSRFRGALLALAGVIIASLLLLLGLMRYRNRLKMKQNEAEMLKADLEDSLTNLKKMQRLLGDGEQADDGKKTHSNKLRAIVNQQIDAVQQLMKLSYQYHGEDFAVKFREAMTLPKTGDESNYWSNLQTLANDLHDNILVKAQETAGGTLNDSELNLLALYCFGFSFTTIMVTMGYKHIGTVYNKKNQIAKKLGVPNLNEFIMGENR